jgi:hypothetical protein
VLSLIVYVVVLGLLYWAVSLLPLPEPFPVVVKVLFIILLILVLLQAFGVSLWLPRLR